jgi:hypothetical protein
MIGRRLALSRLVLGVCLLVLTLGGPAAALAAGPHRPPAQDSAITLEARGGFDGYYKDARWVPMRLTVSNDGPDARGSLQVSVARGAASQLTIAQALELPSRSRKEIYLYIPTEGYVTSLQVKLIDGRNELAADSVRLVQVGNSDLLYGVLAGSGSAFNVLSDVDPLNGSAFVAELELADLPPASFPWQSLDVLVMSDVDTGALSPEQRAALAGWVASGGRLLVGGGPTWQKTAAGLAEVLPLLPSGTQTVTDLASLAAFAAGGLPAGRAAVVATGQLAPDAVVLAEAAGTPLIATRHSGFGQVVYLAADPGFDPLAGWDGLEGLFRNILTGTAERPSWAGGLRSWYSARDAVNALPGLSYPSAIQICGFLGFYLIAVGPVNYLVLRRLKRRELAWLTIPGIVLVFSVGAYLTGYQLRGANAVLHRLAVVQVWPDADSAQVDGLLGLFSPQRASFDLAFADGFLARPIPVDNFGGSAANYTVQQAGVTHIDDVRMEVGAVEPFVAQGHIQPPQFESNLVLDVTGSGMELHGTVTNRSDLALSDVVVLAPGGVWRIGDLGPNGSAEVQLSLTNSKATPASTNNVLPAVADPSGALAQPYYPPSSYDTTIDDILGTGNYYTDREQYRRFQLLSSVIDTSTGSVRDAGIYLVGWTDDSPLAVDVVGRTFSTVDKTLYFVNLRPELQLSQGVVAIPPGLMTWISLSPSQSVSGTPYGMSLYQGVDFVLRFMPTQVVSFKGVQGLTLHLESYGLTGPSGVEVLLWDWTEGVWVPQTALDWGSTEVQAPARFVGPNGDIQARVSNTGQLQVTVERLDFTLYVER